MIMTAYWMNCLEHMMISSKSEIQQRKKNGDNRDREKYC